MNDKKADLTQVASKLVGLGIEIYESNNTTRSRNIGLGLPARHGFKKTLEENQYTDSLIEEFNVDSEIPRLNSDGSIDASMHGNLIRVAEMVERDWSSILCRIITYAVANRSPGVEKHMTSLAMKFNKEYTPNGDPRDKYQELFIDGFLDNKGAYNYVLPLGPADGKTTLAKKLIKKWVFDKNRDSSKNIISYLTNTNKEAREIASEIKKENYASRGDVLILNPLSSPDTLEYRFDQLKSFISSMDLDNTLIESMYSKKSHIKIDEVIIPNFLNIISEALYEKYDSKSGIPTKIIKKIQKEIPELYFFLKSIEQNKILENKRVIHLSNQDVYFTLCKRRTRFRQIVDSVDITIVDEGHKTFSKFSELGIIDGKDKKNGDGDSEDLARKLSPFLKELSIVLDGDSIEESKLSRNIYESILDLNRNALGIYINTDEFEKAVIDIFKQGYDLNLCKAYLSRQHNLFQGEIEIPDEKFKPPSFIYLEGLPPERIKNENKPINILKTKLIYENLVLDISEQHYSTYDLKDLQAFLYTAERTLAKKWEQLIGKYVGGNPSDGWDILKRPLKKVTEILFGSVSDSIINKFNSDRAVMQVAFSHLTKTQEHPNSTSHKFSVPSLRNLLKHSDIDDIYGSRIIQLTGTPEDNGLGCGRVLKGKEQTPLENCLDLKGFSLANSAYWDYHREKIGERSDKSKESVCYNLGTYDGNAPIEPLLRQVVKEIRNKKLKTSWFLTNNTKRLKKTEKILKDIYGIDGSARIIVYTKDKTDEDINKDLQSGVSNGENVFIVSTLDKAEASNLVYNKNKKKHDLDSIVFLDKPTFLQSESSDIINSLDLKNNLSESLYALSLDFNNPPTNTSQPKITKALSKYYNITDKDEYYFKNKSSVYKQALKRIFRLSTNDTTKLIFAFDLTIPYLEYAVRDDKTVSGCIIREMIGNQKKLDLTPLWDNVGIYKEIKKLLVEDYGYGNTEEFLDNLGLVDTIKFQCEKHEINYPEGCYQLDEKFESISGFYDLLDLFHYRMATATKVDQPKTFNDIILGLGSYVLSEKDLNAHTKGFKYEDVFIKKHSGLGFIENKEFVVDFIIKRGLSDESEEDLFDEYHELADFYLINEVDEKIEFVDVKSIGGDMGELSDETRNKFISAVLRKILNLKEAFEIIFGRPPLNGEITYRYVYQASKKHILSKNNKSVREDGINIEFKSGKF